MSTSIRIRRRLSRRAVLLAVVAAGTVIAGVAIAVSLLGNPTVPRVPAPTPAGVSGYAFADANGNGVQDAGEEPLADVTVRLYSLQPLPIFVKQTDEYGVFEFPVIDNLVKGETSVRIRVTPIIDGRKEVLPPKTGLSQEYTVDLGESRALPVKVFTLCRQLEKCSDLDPPELAPVLTSPGGDDAPPSTKTFVDTEEIPGRTLLRFATSTANTGGLMHIVARETTRTERGESQPVEQIVYGDRHVYIHDAGEFLYHEVRQRFHVNNYVSFDLLAPDKKKVLASNTKVSFCLTDVQQYAVEEREEGEVFLELRPAECGLEEQGINSGWADYYGPQLHDQWVDVTGLPAGKYWIRMSVDPEQQYVEASHENNEVMFEIDYTPPAS